MSRLATQLITTLFSNVLLRLFTFGISIWITRILLPAEAGMGFSYQVYMDFVSFLCHEAIRNTCLRCNVLEKGRLKDIQPRSSSMPPGAAEDECIEDDMKGEEDDEDCEDSRGLLKLDHEGVVQNLNTGILCLPMCVLVVAFLELLGFIVPSLGRGLGILGGASSSLGSSSVSSTQHGAASHSHSPAGMTVWSPLPSLSAASVELSRTYGVRRALTSDGVIWLSLLISVLAVPNYLLFLSLGLVRPVFIAEGVAVAARLYMTVIGFQYWIPPGESRDEASVRLVFALSFATYAVVYLVFSFLCCSGPLWWRRLVGVSAFSVEDSLERLYAAAATATATATATAEVGEASEPNNGYHKPLRGKVSLPSSSASSREESSSGGRFGRCCRRSSTSGGLPRLLIFPYYPFGLIRTQLVVSSVRKQATLLWTFFRDSMLRLILAEGGNMAMLSVSDVAASGCFQTIVRLGALATRLLFRVWEGACQAHWSQQSAALMKERRCQFESHQRATATANISPSSVPYGVTPSSPTAYKKEHFDAVLLLRRMLRLSLYIGVAGSWLGSLSAKMVLTLLYRRGGWSSPAMVHGLQLYAHTIGLIACNGLLESFVRAMGSPALLRRHQAWTFCLSLLYLTGNYGTLFYLDRRSTVRRRGMAPPIMLPEGAAAAKTAQAGGSDLEPCGNSIMVSAMIWVNAANMLTRIGISLLVCLTTTVTTAASEVSEWGHSIVLLQARDVLSVVPLQPIPLVSMLIWFSHRPIFYDAEEVGGGDTQQEPSIKWWCPPLFGLAYLAVVVLTDEELRHLLQRWWRR